VIGTFTCSTFCRDTYRRVEVEGDERERAKEKVSFGLRRKPRFRQIDSNDLEGSNLGSTRKVSKTYLSFASLLGCWDLPKERKIDPSLLSTTLGLSRYSGRRSVSRLVQSNGGQVLTRWLERGEDFDFLEVKFLTTRERRGRVRVCVGRRYRSIGV